MGICYMAQKIQTRPLHKPRVVGWGGRWEEVQKGEAMCLLMADSC